PAIVSTHNLQFSFCNFQFAIGSGILSATTAAAATSAPALPLTTRARAALTLAALRLTRLSLILTALTTLTLIASLASASALALPLASNLIFRARHQTKLTIGYDLLARLQTIFDDGHRFDGCASLDDAHLNSAVGPGNIDE